VTGGKRGAGTWGVVVPVTSEKSIFYIGWFDEQGDAALRDQSMQYQNIDRASMLRIGIDRDSTDREEKFSRANNWAQDRAKMKAGNAFAGLPLFIPEDIAVAESAGKIYDRSEENLVPADQAIVRIRRMLLGIARDVQEGNAPLGLATPVDTSEIYTQEVTLKEGDEWSELAVPAAFRGDSGAKTLESA
jgi:hypothetical protein